MPAPRIESNVTHNKVAVAHSVAATTAQLVSASRAQADPSSESQKKLSAAAKAVAAATSQLVEAAKMVAENAKADALVNRHYTLSRSAKADLERQIEIIKLEKQLQQARDELLSSRKAQYSARN